MRYNQLHIQINKQYYVIILLFFASFRQQVPVKHDTCHTHHQQPHISMPNSYFVDIGFVILWSTLRLYTSKLRLEGI